MKTRMPMGKSLQEKNVGNETKFPKDYDVAQHVHESLFLDLPISPFKRIILYNPQKMEFKLKDGNVLKIVPTSLANIFGKSLVGFRPRECIYALGVQKVRNIFRRHARSSERLDFTMFD